MTTATPTSLSLSEKKRLWNQQKYDKFEQISSDKSLMFNYFVLNNDIFKMIKPEDYLKFRTIQVKCQNQKSNVFLGSFAAVFLIDNVIFRYAFPRIRINRFRPAVNLMKYAFTPCLIYTVYKEYFMEDYQYFFYKMQEKYSFGFQDYMKANRIFERALAVDRLEQLLEKRDQFNWTGIPQLPLEDSKESKEPQEKKLLK